MFVNVHDTVRSSHATQKNTEMCDGDLFEVHIEELASSGGTHMGRAGNVWRVWYTDKYLGNHSHMKHYTNEARAREGFREAVDYSGFLGLD